MSNNKQSSVEWLINKLIEHQIIKVGQTTYGGKVNYKHEILLEQAKAMHKEEIMEAHYAPQYGCFSKDYYNEKFNDEQTN